MARTRVSQEHLRAARREAAVSVLERFWGRSNGGAEAWGEMLSSLNALELDAEDRAFLRANLPVPETQGTTAARIARAGQCLDLMGLA